MKRLAVLAAAAAVAAAACAGQGGTTAPSASPSESAAASASESASGSAAASSAGFDWKKYSGTTITFLANQHPWTDGMQKVLPQFEAETGIKVNVQSFSEDLYFDKMEQTLRANPGTADVYFLPMDSTGYSQFNAGLIQPLTPYLDDPSKTTPDYDMADFPAGFLTGGTYPPGDANAKLYGIPISFETYILFYNKDLVSQVPATFGDLITSAQQITKDKGAQGISGAVMRGIRSDTIMDTLSGVVFNAYGDKPTPAPYGLWFDGAWTKPRLTDTGVCQGLADYGAMLAAGPANKYAIDWPDANTLFSQGKAAYFIDASLFGPSYEDKTTSQVAGKVGYAVLPPSAAGGTSYSGAWLWGLGIPQNAPNKDAAWYFIQWMTDKANTAQIGTSTGGAPRNSSYTDPVYTGALNPDYVKTVNTSMQTVRSTVVFKEGWKDGALAIVDTMLAISQGKDQTASCAAGNVALDKAVNK
jgi:multiple sugar transport system substrate-binding protein